MELQGTCQWHFHKFQLIVQAQAHQPLTQLEAVFCCLFDFESHWCSGAKTDVLSANKRTTKNDNAKTTFTSWQKSNENQFIYPLASANQNGNTRKAKGYSAPKLPKLRVTATRNDAGRHIMPFSGKAHAAAQIHTDHDH